MLMPGIIPLSDLRKHQARVLKEVRKRPVVLTQRGHGVAVLVSLEQWEQLLELLEDYDDALTALEARQSESDEPAVPLEHVLAQFKQDHSQE